MEIEFKTSRLAKTCSTRKKSVRKWGDRIAKLVGLRLEELASAETLEDFRRLPHTGFHPLKGTRKRQFAVNVGHPHRLVFEPAVPPPKAADGSLDLAAIKAIRVIEVVDYRG